MSRDAKPPPGSVYRRELPHTLVELQSAEGKERFSSALARGDAEAFFPLVSQWQTQAHPSFCGLTSLSTILNALEIDPKRVWAHPWRWFAESLLTCCLDLEKIRAAGVTIDQLACIARCQGAAVSTHRHLDAPATRALIRRSVAGGTGSGGSGGGEQFEFVVASYDRRTLGQTGSGHFSPIAAYDHASDSALVLDTARFKYGPHWVPIDLLVEATKPIDPSSSLPRGFLTFRKLAKDDIPDKNNCVADECKDVIASGVSTEENGDEDDKPRQKKKINK